MNEKLCECGCGQPTRISAYTNVRDGRRAGEPMRFLQGHHMRLRQSTQKYRVAKDRGRIRPAHVVLVERVLGRPLRAGAQVHHVNEDKHDNRPENLVVCQDNAYHMLLHSRLRALRACGNASWRKCTKCGRYDDTANLCAAGKWTFAHRECLNQYNREYYHRGNGAKRNEVRKASRRVPRCLVTPLKHNDGPR